MIINLKSCATAKTTVNIIYPPVQDDLLYKMSSRTR